MSDQSNGREDMRNELVEWSMAKSEATGDRAWCDCISAFFEDMAAYHAGSGDDLREFLMARPGSPLRMAVN